MLQPHHFRNRSLLTKRFQRPLSLAYQLHEPSNRVIARPPLVILHGLFGSKQNNRSISRVLAEDLKAKVFALDLRNHGESPHDGVHCYLAMADDIEEFVNEHGLRRPALIGHSMGAKAAMTIALRSPNLIRALVPVDNAPVDASLSSEFPKYIEGLREIEESAPQKQAEADQILQKYEQEGTHGTFWLAANLFLQNLAIRQFLLTNLVRSRYSKSFQLRIPLKVLASALNHMGDFPYKDPETHRFEGPTLVIRGTKSHYVADDVLPVFGNFFPKFTVRDIEAGHWVMSDNPHAFMEAVRYFLREIDSLD